MKETPKRETLNRAPAKRTANRTVKRTAKRRPATSRSRKAARRPSMPGIAGIKPILAGAAIVLVLILLIFGIRSCGSSHKSPEGVVKSLIGSYAKGKESRIKDCYGAKKDADDNLLAEISATIKYFQAHKPKKVSVDKCSVLYEDKNNAYVYIIYSMELENGQSYPCLSTYMTEQRDGKYYVLPPAKVTDEMSRQAATTYAKFMTTNDYKEYMTAYDTFIKKNPGYEDRIAGKLT